MLIKLRGGQTNGQTDEWRRLASRTRAWSDVDAATGARARAHTDDAASCVVLALCVPSRPTDRPVVRLAPRLDTSTNHPDQFVR